MQTTLHAIATANPIFKLPQAEACQFMAQVEGLSQALRRRIPAIYASSEIDRRYSCIPDYGANPGQFQFYPNNWDLSPFPTTADRNQFYTQQATPLAVHACRDALIQSPYSAEDITHLIVVSCTGFSAPGVDIQIIQQLNLCSTVARTLIGFMGCHGALNGLKVAHDICQSNPLARVLMVCVELCTLHFQIEDSIESVVTNALFSDGSAAVVLSSEPGAEKSLHYCSGHSLVMPDSQSLMSWTIGNTGFLMGLSSQVPDRIGANIARYIDTVLDAYHLSRSDLAFWAVHPGGIQIVKQVQTALDLAQSQLRDSYDVLRDYGNMSSPTILFILKRILDRLSQDDLRQDDLHKDDLHKDDLSKPQLGSAMAFGPGLTIECALFEVS